MGLFSVVFGCLIFSMYGPGLIDKLSPFRSPRPRSSSVRTRSSSGTAWPAVCDLAPRNFWRKYTDACDRRCALSFRAGRCRNIEI
eukprot:SAG31_NODE_168_length_21484_cov_21.524994_4_plen_85_part_00